jgi:hypothetical protein
MTTEIELIRIFSIEHVHASRKKPSNRSLLHTISFASCVKATRRIFRKAQNTKASQSEASGCISKSETKVAGTQSMTRSKKQDKMNT